MSTLRQALARHRTAGVLGLAGLLALGAGGAAWWRAQQPPGTWARIQQLGQLQIGYAIEAPYAWRDAQSRLQGESTGLAQLVVDRLAQRHGTAAKPWHIHWVQLDFDGLIPALRSGRIDVVAAGMFITPERATQVRTSRPTLQVQPAWLVRQGAFAADRTAGLPALPAHFAQAAATPGFRVAVLSGSAERAQLQRLGMPADRLVAVPDAASGSALVEAQRVDALALSWPAVVRLAADSHGRLLALRAPGPHPPGTVGLVGFQFRLADGELQQAWDVALADVLGSPAHLQLLQSQGLDADDLPTRLRPLIDAGASDAIPAAQR